MCLRLFLNCCKEERHIVGYMESVVPRYSNSEFERHFRLHLETFSWLVHDLAWNDLPWASRPCPDKSPFALEKQLLITLWIMGSQETIQSVADRFGTSESATYCTF